MVGAGPGAAQQQERPRQGHPRSTLPGAGPPAPRRSPAHGGRRGQTAAEGTRQGRRGQTHKNTGGDPPPDHHAQSEAGTHASPPDRRPAGEAATARAAGGRATRRQETNGGKGDGGPGRAPGAQTAGGRTGDKGAHRAPPLAAIGPCRLAARLLPCRAPDIVAGFEAAGGPAAGPGGHLPARTCCDKGGQRPRPASIYSAQRPGASGKRAQEWGQPTRTPAEYVQVAGGLPPDKRATLAWQLHATWGQGAICPERMRVMRPFEPLSHRFGCISLLGCAARAADDGRRALDSCRYPPGFDLRCWPW